MSMARQHRRIARRRAISVRHEGRRSHLCAYRDGILCDDDEVAILHGPEELGYPAVTEAMVNIRATLDKAVIAGVLDGWLVARLTEIGKALFYKERTWGAILDRATASGLPPMPLGDLSAWLHGGRVDQKETEFAGDD